MKRVMIIGAVAAIVALAGAGALHGRDILDGMRFEKAMSRIGEADQANGGTWPQPQETCFFCHGAHGQSLNAWYPALSGQPAAYLAAQLRAFASEQRHNPYMGPLARDLDDGQVKTLAAYFARQTPTRNEDVPADAALAKRGMALIQARSCQACHGATLMGRDQAPRLAGQGEIYLATQLAAFKTGERRDPAGAMNGMAATLSGDDIRAVAHYLASVSPGQADGAVR
ncbi:c-type cytochrome [Burkholderia ubonensis]|uniref:c-type cytochrome n=1 Tax=Burkholderia ubonensis TaxID=101571 RepID=UPI00075A7362|nr:c-type cytochrome [Burkholderia ubonensis]KVP60256.1 cytochrome C [Burkholderia ubonensis]KVR51586.1 cytochrome C [Burkholderia ubonensis]KVW37094.1 cytochrome C [Burkholderia ubonensis]OJA81930.1 cytochrome C [Burkholderia ubonensis]